MSKKTAIEITEYYKKKHVVSTYDQQRFSGNGGEYITKTEVASITDPLYFLPTNITALDIGAGRGRLSIPLKRKGFAVYVLDRSKEMVQVLRPHFSHRILLQSIFDPLPKRLRFHLITGLRFFDHFDLKHQKAILKNLKNSLDDTGYIAFAALNRQSLESVVSPLFAYGRYNFFYSDREYREMFRGAGFDVKKRNAAFFFPRGVFLPISSVPGLVWFLSFVDAMLLRLFPDFGALFIYILTKKQ